METVLYRDRKAWRKWLRLNHKMRREVWLVLPKKSAGGESYRVYYNAALEEAICYGWIDSRIKPLDETRSMVRFTPRRSKHWSNYNLKRTRALMSEGKMTRAGLKALPEEMVRQAREETGSGHGAKRRVGRTV